MEAMKVKDLMVPLDEYAVISEDATLFDAVRALEESRLKYDTRGYRHRAVLVKDATGAIVGKLSQWDVLRSLEPKYNQIGDLKKLSGFGLSAEFLHSMIDRFELWKRPLDDLCRKASDLRVGDIVSSPEEAEMIDAEASLNQAVHQLIMGRHQSLLVKAGEQVAGILRLSDVFGEVAARMRRCKV
ncbi:MAG: HPP family protein [Desulfomonilaceae bacterium]